MAGVGRRSAATTLRLARAAVALALVGFAVLVIDEELAADRPVAVRVLLVLAVVALLVQQVWLSTRLAGGIAPWLGVLALTAQAALVAAPVLVGGRLWLGVPGLLVASLLVLRLRVAVPIGVLVVVAVVLHELSAPPPATAARLALVVTELLVVALVVLVLTELPRVTQRVLATQAELARVAAEQERSRLARDVHDLLGLSLSAITLKCELAARLLPSEAELTRVQLGEVLHLARRALADVRSVALAPAEQLHLDEEFDLAEDTLLAVDVRVVLERAVPAPGGRVGAALATVLREGVTNVIRHSDASWCRISMTSRGDRVLLRIVNDGVREDEPAATDGQGLRNLMGRVRPLGGELHVEGDGVMHALEVGVPVRDEAPEPPLCAEPPGTRGRARRPRV